MHDREKDEALADRLLAEDRPAVGAVPGSAGSQDGHAWLQVLLDREEAAERRVRHAAVWAWKAVVALVPLIGVSALLVRVVGDGLLRDAVRIGAIVLGVFALLALFLAALMTVAWLFRSRSVSLAVIERRLAALEERLMRTRP